MARVQIAAATLSGNSLRRQTVHTHCASVHQAAKLVAALLRVAGVTAGLAESNGSLPPGLWLTSPAGWLPRTGITSGTLRSVGLIEYGLPLPFLLYTRRWTLNRMANARYSNFDVACIKYAKFFFSNRVVSELNHAWVWIKFKEFPHIPVFRRVATRVLHTVEHRSSWSHQAFAITDASLSKLNFVKTECKRSHLFTRLSLNVLPKFHHEIRKRNTCRPVC